MSTILMNSPGLLKVPIPCFLTVNFTLHLVRPQTNKLGVLCNQSGFKNIPWDTEYIAPLAHIAIHEHAVFVSYGMNEWTNDQINSTE